MNNYKNLSQQDVEKLFGSKIKNLRCVKKLTQEELASQCKLSRTAVYNLEMGKGTLDSLLKVLTYLEKLEPVLSSLEPEMPTSITELEQVKIHINQKRVRHK